MKKYVLTRTMHGAVKQAPGTVIELTDELANSALYKTRIRPVDVVLVAAEPEPEKGGEKEPEQVADQPENDGDKDQATGEEAKEEPKPNGKKGKGGK